ncbi:hypothetical protein PH31N_09653 [Cutibacterium modestum 31N]|nr:hypothetical protein [Cutibacterium modestum 31N]
MAQVLTIRDIKLPTMVEEQPPCITGNVAISTTVHLAPNDIGAFTDTDELRILMESARSHGYLSQPQLESRKYLIEEPIGVVISDISQAEYLTLRLDSYPGHHLIGRPGMKTMLVLADALRLIGLSTPQSIDVECIDFDPHGWDLLNPDPEYPWLGHTPRGDKETLTWHMPDDITALGWLFDLITLLQGQPPQRIHATPGEQRIRPW